MFSAADEESYSKSLQKLAKRYHPAEQASRESEYPQVTTLVNVFGDF